MKKKYQFFISSTYQDLKEARLEAINTILKSNNIPLGMEAFPAAGKTQMEVIKKMIDQADFYILIIGGRYGSIEPESKKSYTELEYDYALKKGIPTLVFKQLDETITKDNMDDHQPQLRNFISRLNNVLYAQWGTIGELGKEILASINSTLSETKDGGWVRYSDFLEEIKTNETYKDLYIKEHITKYMDQLKSCIEKLYSQECLNISGKNLLQQINNEILSCISEISLFLRYLRRNFIKKATTDRFSVFDTPYCEQFRRLFNRILNYSGISPGIFETELAYLFTVYGLYDDDVMNDLQYNKYFNNLIHDLRSVFNLKDRNNINNWNLLLENIKESTKNKTSADFRISDTVVGTFYTGDYSEILLPFFEELYKIFTSLDEEKLEEIEKKVIAEKLKEHLTIEIQCLLFFHSISYVGRKWGVESEYNNITRKKYNLMNKFQLIDKIPKNFIYNISFYYPKITFEFEN